MHKKLYILLFALILLAGIFLFIQIKRAAKITIKQNSVSLIAQNAIYIPLSDSELIYGNPGAPITIVEFVDFDCEACMALHTTIESFVSKHPQDVRLVWKSAPQPKLLTKDLALAHQAAWCASQEDEKKFWQFVRAAGQQSNNIREPGLKTIGQNLQLGIGWWPCATGAAAQQKIADSLQLANSLGIKKLPAIFINNKRINTEADINIEEMLNSFIAK